MKKILLVFCLFLFTSKIFAQQFSQYNTGTLYDSFENPSQRAFIPDSSKKFAFNFLVPNFSGNFNFSGDAQATVKSRIFLDSYDNSALKINQGRFNHLGADANVYFIMLKMFASVDGEEELGFSWQSRAEGKGLVPDDAVAALNGTQSFNDAQLYTNIFNGNYYHQTYNQFSFTYRERLSPQFVLGVKISALSGVQFEKLNITGSNVIYDKLLDTAGVHLRGTYYSSYIPGPFARPDYLPGFRNPGASISIGTSYRTEDGVTFQGNIKDLGFIHWSGLSRIYTFDNSANIGGLSTPKREDSIYNKIVGIIRNNATIGAFTTNIDGRAEISATKSFWLDDDRSFKYSPTAIASKELFYTGFAGALVNPFQYDKYVVTVTTAYDDLKEFSLGLQFMIKTSNFEFYIGSDKLTQSTSLALEYLNKNPSPINSSYTGANIFLGFAVKFGPLVEHPMNASSIPKGEKGFLGQLWNRFFKTYD
jgi:hypothetical protein